MNLNKINALKPNKNHMLHMLNDGKYIVQNDILLCQFFWNTNG